MTKPLRKAVDPNPEEASAIKRMVGDSPFVVVNLGDRQALIEILDDQNDAQRLFDSIMSDPKQAERLRESVRQESQGQSISLDEIKKRHLNG